MDLKNYQHLLAKVYTDASLRQKFMDNPEAVAADFDIDPSLVQNLVHELSQPIRFFSQSLIRKRWGIIQHYLPLTLLCLDDKAFDCFSSFAEQHSLVSKDRYTQDALNFGKWILQQDANQIDLAKWQRELIMYEILRLRLEKPFFRWRIFFHNVRKIARELRGKTSLHPYKPPTRLACFIHWHWFQQHHQFYISL